MVVPDEPKESVICGCAAVSVVSQAICQAGAMIKPVSLYHHISTLRFDEVGVLLAIDTFKI